MPASRLSRTFKNCIPLTRRLALAFLLWASASVLPTWSQPHELQELSISVKVVNEQGDVVENAALEPYALRLSEISEQISWEAAQLALRPQLTTGENGLSELPCPKTVRYRAEVMSVRQISVCVRHRDYLDARVHIAVPPSGPTQIVLERGGEVQISAVDPSDRPISEFAVCMAGPFATSQWQPDGQSGRQSRSVKPGKWQTLLVQFQPGDRNLFSNVLPLPVRLGQIIRIRNVKLLPGTVVTGQLSSNVPRPVINGRVYAVSVPQPAGASQVREDPSLTWQETVAINPDGTFALPSLPRGGQVQLLSICEGWISKSTLPENPQSITGQLFDLPSDRRDVTMEMEPTTNINVDVSSGTDRPAGISVVAHANLWLYKSGLLAHNNFQSSRDTLRVQLGSKTKPMFHQPFASIAMTDRFGRAQLSGLPIGLPVQISIEHPRYALSRKDGVRTRTYIPQPNQAEILRLEVEEAE